MTDLVQRSFTAEFDVRRTRRLIEGLAVPLDHPQLVSDDGRTTYTESWDRAAFNDQLRHGNNIGRVRFTYDHLDGLTNWLGKAVDLVAEPDGLHGVWRVDDTETGDVALYKAGSGQLTGLSVGARPDESVTRGDVVARVRAWLYHVSLVEDPAFDLAQVAAVRKKQTPIEPSPWIARAAELKAKRPQG